MSKQYGLILKKKPGEDQSNRSNYEATRLKRESKMVIDKALEEDPNIFAYDEIYDDMKKKDQEVHHPNEKLEKKERKSKFIENLKMNAEQRKATEERRQDRKIEKEREAEGDLFKDKEVFVTDAYRQKLMERKIYEERERKEQELEDMMDVRKHEHGMAAFYRNFLNQKVGEQVELNPKEKYLDKMTEDLRKQLIDKKEVDKAPNDQAEFKKLAKSSTSKRHRRSSSSSEEDVVIQSLRKNKERKKHEETSGRTKHRNEVSEKEKKSVIKQDSKSEEKTEINLKNENEIDSKDLKKEDVKLKNEGENNEKNSNEEKANEETIIEPEPIKLNLREILTELFRKRCVDDEFVESQRRYFERKTGC